MLSSSCCTEVILAFEPSSPSLLSIELEKEAISSLHARLSTKVDNFKIASFDILPINVGEV
jgi:hypothetical protein